MLMDFHFRNISLWLVIISIFTMGISPACEFINSKSATIEICSEDGEVKAITLAEAGIDIPLEGKHDRHDKSKDCVFCFASSHGKAMKSAYLLVDTPLTTAYIRLSPGTISPRSLEKPLYQPRAPPTFFV
ncbi:MAG: hypothetical protein KTR28_02830 [Micavibrio sp.]|nr:hypothetical protein [Micavibrio sp.]